MAVPRDVVAGLLLAAAALGGPTGGQAQTLAEKQTMRHEDGVLADRTAVANDLCGTTIKASFGWSSFLVAGKVGDMNGSFDNPPADMCAVPLSALQSLCHDEAVRRAVRARIRSYVCIYQERPAEAHALDADGRLELRSNYGLYHFGYDDSSSRFSMNWLRRTLSTAR